LISPDAAREGGRPALLARLATAAAALPSADAIFDDESLWNSLGIVGDWRGERYRDAVYFIKAEGLGLIRIGISRREDFRLVQHQSSSPVALTLLGHVPGSLQVERLFHDAFAPIRARSSWYHSLPILRRTIHRVTVL